ncbi:BrnA antitoxin family protein [Thalassospira sp. NFXS8]|uniref:BrnA antitoxin family protein n=1 Tax=Thalassospira sp. NFXS8 TaxID=2819093 RepID=UPI0032DF1D8F
MTDAKDTAITKAARDAPDTQLVDSLMRKKRGRPFAEATTTKVSIRLSPEVLDASRATGNGWQTRVDELLRKEMGL